MTYPENRTDGEATQPFAVAALVCRLIILATTKDICDGISETEWKMASLYVLKSDTAAEPRVAPNGTRLQLGMRIIPGAAGSSTSSQASSSSSNPPWIEGTVPLLEEDEMLIGRASDLASAA